MSSTALRVDLGSAKHEDCVVGARVALKSQCGDRVKAFLRHASRACPPSKQASMDDFTSYYAPPLHHSYYQPPPPPPPPPGTAHPPPAAVAQPIHVQSQFVYAPPIYPQSSQDQLRTLFVAGLPEDVKPREIYNLFRECPGYQSSNLRPPTSSNNQPFAFATFADQQSAVMALHALNTVMRVKKSISFQMCIVKEHDDSILNPEALQTAVTLTLRIRNDQTNNLLKFFLKIGKSIVVIRSKRLRADDGSQGSEKRLKGYAAFSRSDDPGVGSIHTPGMGNSAYNTIGYPSTQSFRNVDGGSMSGASSKSTGTPCPTIFVANLGPTSSEEELMQVFSRCRGFLKLKMQSTYGAPVAFVDFQDTACSTEALSYLQGTVLYSSTSGEGMRLEYPF
ncbi:hypothetical protein DH2020_012383 [Rehmannia glutinosa]|uniref:RRM domain-containing protein n=1 Tax=Rehmannia glutinosa TaxID=99300 RepID=A0ABR0X2A8_REHGL